MCRNDGIRCAGLVSEIEQLSIEFFVIDRLSLFGIALRSKRACRTR